jgi:hypothetical protein
MAEFPQVPEQDAPPEIAAIYRAIRAVSGLPVVNLIWRHFAALPGVLPWAWTGVRPLIGSAALDAARGRVASELRLPEIAPPGSAAWLRAGVSDQDLRRIEAINAAYIRGNLTNALALTALRLRLQHPERPGAEPPPGNPHGEPPPHLEPLPRMGDLAPGLAARIRDLAGRHAIEGGVIPSLYLAFSPWPGLIEALPSVLAPLYEPAVLLATRASTCRLVEAEACGILPAPGKPPVGVAAMQPGLELFTRLVIPDLLAVGLAIRRLLATTTP